jgi:hypothetical protein
MSGQPHAPAALPPEKKTSIPTEYEAGFYPTAVLDVSDRRKISYPCRDSKPGPSSQQSVSYSDFLLSQQAAIFTAKGVRK